MASSAQQNTTLAQGGLPAHPLNAAILPPAQRAGKSPGQLEALLLVTRVPDLVMVRKRGHWAPQCTAFGQDKKAHLKPNENEDTSELSRELNIYCVELRYFQCCTKCVKVINLACFYRADDPPKDFDPNTHQPGPISAERRASCNQCHRSNMNNSHNNMVQIPGGWTQQNYDRWFRHAYAGRNFDPNVFAELCGVLDRMNMSPIDERLSPDVSKAKPNYFS